MSFDLNHFKLETLEKKELENLVKLLPEKYTNKDIWRLQDY